MRARHRVMANARGASYLVALFCTLFVANVMLARHVRRNQSVFEILADRRQFDANWAHEYAAQMGAHWPRHSEAVRRPVGPVRREVLPVVEHAPAREVSYEPVDAEAAALKALEEAEEAERKAAAAEESAKAAEEGLKRAESAEAATDAGEAAAAETGGESSGAEQAAAAAEGDTGAGAAHPAADVADPGTAVAAAAIADADAGAHAVEHQPASASAERAGTKPRSVVPRRTAVYVQTSDPDGNAHALHLPPPQRHYEQPHPPVSPEHSESEPVVPVREAPPPLPQQQVAPPPPAPPARAAAHNEDDDDDEKEPVGFPGGISGKRNHKKEQKEWARFRRRPRTTKGRNEGLHPFFFLPKFCNCRLPAHADDMCFFYTGGDGGECRERPCPTPEYLCEPSKNTGLTCVLQEVKQKIVQTGRDACKTLHVVDYRYVPFSAA